MKKKLLLPFESPRDHYRAEATVVWCTDARFSLVLQVLQGKMGWRSMDIIRVFGGARDLGTMASAEEVSSLLGQIGRSVKVNHSPNIFLMAHYDCEAYGREQVEQNQDEDILFYTELSQAKKRVEDYLSGNELKATVRVLLVDFKNVYEVEVN